MKRLYVMLPLACALTFTACDDYDDTALWEQVNDNTSRIEALEQWQDEVNNNIAALQQLLNTNDMITSVTPVTLGGEVTGYTITFLHSDPITIYHGEKGEDGADGSTPQISLTRQEDGNWYWTLNGSLMTDAEGNPIRANGEDGKDGEDGQDGVDGDDGEDGTDGSDGKPGATGKPGTSAPTPQIKLGSSITSGTIETDNGTNTPDAWYLSVDNGKTWYRISGKEGAQGNPGSEGQQGPQGDSMFEGEPKLSNDGTHYIFTLANNGGTIEVAAYQSLQILTEDEHNSSGSSDNDTAPVRAEGEATFYLSMNAETDYKAIVAEVTPLDDDVVLTRAASEWSATVQEAADGNITVTVTAPTAGKALLDVSLIRTDGSKVTASRVLEALGFTIADGGNTYIIYTAGGLQAWATEMRNDPAQNLNCTLADDITLPVVTDGGSNWTPIQGYAGTFDGNGKTITGLNIDQSTGSNVGLFASIAEGGTVKNLTLDDVDITAGSNVGAIAGENRGTIENCSVSGSVTGSSDNSCVGGIAGWHREGTITDCHSSATVESKAYVGGIAGQSSAIVGTTTITACYSTGSVTATTNSNYYSYAGGVVGLNSNGTVLTACYATGDVKGDGDCVGGVVGDNVVGTVTACYHATGDVTSVSSSTGGVAGRNYADQYGGPGTITACYWNGTVSYDRGIGNDVLLAGGATKVEGSTTWETAMNAMNAVLSGTGWQYVTSSGDAPLTLQKQ